jgi:outer membrane protein assembly factor BamB
LNKSSGALVWEVKLGQSIGASPVIVGDRVYWAVEVGSPTANGYLAVVERCTGRVLFYSSPLGDHTHCTPTVLIRQNIEKEARVYLGANTGRFHCLNANNGKQLWEFETFGLRARSISVNLKMPQNTPMATIARAVCQQDKTLCFMSEGALRQKGQIKGTAAVFDDRVVFGSWDHCVYCLNATNGLLLWKFMSTDLVMSSAAIDPRERRVFIGSHSGVLVALSLDTGQLLWSVQTNGRLMSSPILVLMAFHEECTKGLTVIIGSFSQSFYVICAQNGRILSRQSLNAGHISNEIAFDSSNSFYVSTNGGHLIKLS